MNWTEKQKEVIDSNGSDLLVAAAAGSGKTAVLVERIKRLIIEEKKDIDRFLVVTSGGYRPDADHDVYQGSGLGNEGKDSRCTDQSGRG